MMHTQKSKLQRQLGKSEISNALLGGKKNKPKPEKVSTTTGCKET